MIDELVKAAKAIDGAGIKVQDWHPKLKTLPKGTKDKPCLRIWLTLEGLIDDIEPLTAEQTGCLLKYEPDAGKSFPGFNVLPLYRIVKSEENLKTAGKELVKALAKEDFSWEAHISDGEDFWDRTRKVLEQLKNRVLPELKGICAAQLQEGETLAKLFNAFGRMDIEQFKADYEKKAKAKVRDGSLPWSVVCYFVDAKKKNKEDADSNVPIPKFSVFVDVRDYTDYPVAHEYTISRLNSFLWRTETTMPHDVQSGKDGLTDAYGLDVKSIDDKFAQVALPVLGGVILRSQIKDKPTQARYNLCDAQTFRVGSESRKCIKRALQWLGAPERSGLTNGQAGEGELLFAYPTTLPKSKLPQLAMMLGAQREDVLAEQKFELLAKSVIDQLKGTGVKARDGELEIFSLRKMDKARTKVVYYRNTTVATLEAASRAWHEGCVNVPLLDIWEWSVKDEATDKSKPVVVVPETSYPVKIYRYLNTVWKQTGEQSGTVKLFSPTDGLKLLLDNDSASLASAMLERFNQHTQGYFVNLCRCKGQGKISKVTDTKFYPAILGLLLYKLENRKESYMNESAFLLGRCLRIADELHRLYCEKVRKNQLPSELCGSSLLVAMQENPAMTMAQLLLRSAPYAKWANAYHGEDGGLVHYWFKLWGDNANDIKSAGGVPTKRLDHAQRAEVFLGYLASFPKKEKGKGDTPDALPNSTEAQTIS